MLELISSKVAFLVVLVVVLALLSKRFGWKPWAAFWGVTRYFRQRSTSQPANATTRQRNTSVSSSTTTTSSQSSSSESEFNFHRTSIGRVVIALILWAFLIFNLWLFSDELPIWNFFMGHMKLFVSMNMFILAFAVASLVGGWAWFFTSLAGILIAVVAVKSTDFPTADASIPSGSFSGPAPTAIAPSQKSFSTYVFMVPNGKDSAGNDAYSEELDVTDRRFNFGPADGEKDGCFKVKVNNRDPKRLCPGDDWILGVNREKHLRMQFHSDENRPLRYKREFFG